MGNIYKSILYTIAAFGIAGCAKAVTEGVNEAEKRYFDAWMQINHPNLKASWNGKDRPEGNTNGIYIFTDEIQEGTGAAVTDNGYAMLEYTVRDLNGNITSYTYEQTARQLGEYSPQNYYGPKVLTTIDQTIQAGVQDALLRMKVGGYTKVIIPSWLMSYATYSSPEKYLKKSSDYASAIYELKVTDFTEDIDKWQADSIERYIAKGDDVFRNDTTGFYFSRHVAVSKDTTKFPSDTTIYINYTGKLLNGLIFDTSDERTALDNDVYNPTKEYGPVKVSWGEDAGSITMSGSSIIDGFSMTLWRMRYIPGDKQWNDKVTGIFTSALGYGYSGSGSSIPAYAPLIFEIEVVPEPEE